MLHVTVHTVCTVHEPLRERRATIVEHMSFILSREGGQHAVLVPHDTVSRQAGATGRVGCSLGVRPVPGVHAGHGVLAVPPRERPALRYRA